jgi:hypothetical protein
MFVFWFGAQLLFGCKYQLMVSIESLMNYSRICHKISVLVRGRRCRAFEFCSFGPIAYALRASATSLFLSLLFLTVCAQQIEHGPQLLIQGSCAQPATERLAHLSSLVHAGISGRDVSPGLKPGASD